MATNIVCARCEQEREGLEQPPMGGPIGHKVQEKVCRDCWQEWRDTSTQLISHYERGLELLHLRSGGRSH